MTGDISQAIDYKSAIFVMGINVGLAVHAFKDTINKSVYPEYHADHECESKEVSDDIEVDENSPYF